MMRYSILAAAAIALSTGIGNAATFFVAGLESDGPGLGLLGASVKIETREDFIDFDTPPCGSCFVEVEFYDLAYEVAIGDGLLAGKAGGGSVETVVGGGFDGVQFFSSSGGSARITSPAELVVGDAAGRLVDLFGADVSVTALLAFKSGEGVRRNIRFEDAGDREDPEPFFAFEIVPLLIADRIAVGDPVIRLSFAGSLGAAEYNLVLSNEPVAFAAVPVPASGLLLLGALGGLAVGARRRGARAA